MPPLTPTRDVPSGMTVALDTGPTRVACVLGLPGRAPLVATGVSAGAVVALSGEGVWAVDVFDSHNGIDFQLVATVTMPGQWRYSGTGLALAVRVSSFTNGTITATLTHGGAAPVTHVSPLFGAFLIFSFNSTPTEPPIGNQIRFNSTTLPDVTRLWIRNSTNDGSDVYFALRRIPFGGTILVQDRGNHLLAALFRVVNPIVDKTDYVEVPVTYQQHTGTLASGQVLVAVFNPGPTLSLTMLPGSPTLVGDDPEALILQLVEAPGFPGVP